MIVGRELLTRHAIRPHRSGTMGHIIRCFPPIEREAAGPAQEVDPHCLPERSPSVYGHEGPMTSDSIRWKEWGKEPLRNIRNSFKVNSLLKF